jgi:hypothetical protein
MRTPALIVAAAAIIVAGCGGEGAVEHYARNACKLSPDSAIIATALRQYLNDQSPRPKRFLYIPSKDSTPPAVGIAILQDEGPTFLFSTDATVQKPLRTKLHQDGDYPTLLVWYHGFKRTDDTHATATWSGQYVGEAEDGTTSPLHTVQLQCDSAGWHALPHGAGPPATLPPSGATS